MDFLEMSSRQELDHTTSSINACLAKPVKRLTYVGYCRCCYEDLDDGRIFCDGLCASEYNRKEVLGLKM